MDRPEHLPDYSDPPLTEVVYGVQFAEPQGFKSINLRDVYDLFQEGFPKVEEHPALDPVFETFGGVQLQPSVQFRLGVPDARTRLWFISDDESHLIQFQIDRFLLNWRRRGEENGYPRFEGIFPVLDDCLGRLAGWMAAEVGEELKINQAEISYINLVPVSSFAEASDWFTFLNLSGLNAEGANTTFTETLSDSAGRPIARLTHELLTVWSRESKGKAFRLTLTVRGAPQNSGLEAALDFIKMGRAQIVERFGQVTTPEAQRRWGRMK